MPVSSPSVLSSSFWSDIALLLSQMKPISITNKDNSPSSLSKNKKHRMQVNSEKPLNKMQWNMALKKSSRNHLNSQKLNLKNKKHHQNQRKLNLRHKQRKLSLRQKQRKLRSPKLLLLKHLKYLKKLRLRNPKLMLFNPKKLKNPKLKPFNPKKLKNLRLRSPKLLSLKLLK